MNILPKPFCHYNIIAETNRETLAKSISTAKFFSILMDGTTDIGVVDDEMFLAVWCEVDGSDERVHTRLSYFSLNRPKEVTAVGLLECLQTALGRLGISEVQMSPEHCHQLVGIGTDGATPNVAAGGLKGLVEKELPWIFWMWCFAHRLELAVKDALKDTVFSEIDEMLLRLYYLYEKSPKKCRQLEDVINDLKQCIQFDSNGVRPYRASGSRWISHKLNAMKRVLSKFGAYANHLTALSTDASTKSADRAKLTGYLRKWTDAKYLIGCAFFVDLLQPCSVFSKVMQEDDIDVLAGCTTLVRTIKEVNKLSSKALDEWPTYSATVKKLTVTQTESGSTTSYQLTDLLRVSQAKDHFKTKFKQYCSLVTDCLRDRLAWSDLELLKDIISVLETQGWQRIVDDSDHNNEPIDTQHIVRLADRFKIPLENAGVDTVKLPHEYNEMIIHATQFYSLSTMGYQAVWWRLFNSPNSSEWFNCLSLARLLLTLPSSRVTRDPS